jgi:hypothetical protein
LYMLAILYGRFKANIIRENYWSYSTCRFSIDTQEHRDHLVELLNLSKLKWWHEEKSTHKFGVYYVTLPKGVRFDGFPKEWYNMSRYELAIIFNEFKLWSGTNGKKYRTSNKVNADFMQFMFAGMCHRASLTTVDRRGTKIKRGSTEYFKSGFDYVVSLIDRELSTIASNHGNKPQINKVESKDGYKYCFTMPFGTLVLRRNNQIFITGNCGKSTIANQLCVMSPLEQGYKTFIYSGELSDGQLKNWIVKPLAGVDHVLRWKNPNTPAGYTPSREASKFISDYYMRNIVLYSDDDALAASNDDIVKQMEDAYRRYGCKIFLIDNLMTVGFSDEDDNIWKSQKEFIKKLLRFTNKYSVNVTLVAHPKKPARGEEPGVYSVHGASELVNLCHRLLWVNLLTDDRDGYSSEIKIIKDRPTGRAGKSCKLYYDNRTMRLYSDVTEQYHKYAWEKHADIKYNEFVTAQLAVNFIDPTDDILGSSPS